MQIDATSTTLRVTIGLEEKPFRRANTIALLIAVTTGCAVALIDALPWAFFAVPALAGLIGLSGLVAGAKRSAWELVVDQHSLRCGLADAAQFCVWRREVDIVELQTDDDVHTHAFILRSGRRIDFPILVALRGSDEAIARAIADLWPDVLVTYRNSPLAGSQRTSL